MHTHHMGVTLQRATDSHRLLKRVSISLESTVMHCRAAGGMRVCCTCARYGALMVHQHRTIRSPGQVEEAQYIAVGR